MSIPSCFATHIFMIKKTFMYLTIMSYNNLNPGLVSFLCSSPPLKCKLIPNIYNKVLHICLSLPFSRHQIPTFSLSFQLRQRWIVSQFPNLVQHSLSLHYPQQKRDYKIHPHPSLKSSITFYLCSKISVLCTLYP